MSDTLVIEFTREKETKNAVRFSEVLEIGADRGIVGSIYILKTNLEDLGDPDRIAVSITAVP
jgi:hypothetical protein